MKVINLLSGPGAGKSTLAAGLFAALKYQGLKVEIAHEAAKDFVYQSRPIRNQVLLFGLQYDQLVNLEAHGCEIAIAECPLALTYFYGQTHDSLMNVVDDCREEFEEYNVWVRRDLQKPFQPFGRFQRTLMDATKIDAKIIKTVENHGVQFHRGITGNAKGLARLIKKVNEDLIAKGI